MNIRARHQAAAALTALALALVVAAPARASDTTPSPSPSVRKSVAVATVLVYKAALANRETTMKAINTAFSKAVKHAKKDLNAALSRSSSPSLKSAAAAKFKDAIDRASAARQAALNSLPALPPVPKAKASGK